MQNGSSGDSCFLHFVNNTWDRGSPIYCTHSLLTSEAASMWYCILTFKCGMVLTICTTYYVVLIIDTQRQRCKTCWVFHVTSFQSIVWVAKAKRPPNKNEFVGMVLGILVKHYFVDFVLWRGGCVDQIGNYFFESKAVGHPLQTQSVVFFRRMYNIFIRIPNTIFITLNHIIKQNWHQFPPPPKLATRVT